MAIIKSGASDNQLTIEGNTNPLISGFRATRYTSTGEVRAKLTFPSFMVSATFTPPATPTDMIIIQGSASKIVRVVSIIVGTTAAAAGSTTYFLLRRSAPNTGGTLVTPGVLSANGVNNPTAIVGHYTANPSVLGQTLGNMNIVRWAAPISAPGNFSGVVREAGREIIPWGANALLDKQIILRGADQILAVNFNGAALLGTQVNYYRVIWTEV